MNIYGYHVERTQSYYAHRRNQLAGHSKEIRHQRKEPPGAHVRHRQDRNRQIKPLGQHGHFRHQPGKWHSGHRPAWGYGGDAAVAYTGA